jgi:hypothetical protein
MMPLRVAMPNSVMKPTSEATLSSAAAEVHRQDAADQRQRQVDHDQQRVAQPSRTPAVAAARRCRRSTSAPSTEIVREAACSLSNCPP